MSMTFTNDENGIRLLAIYVSQLIREGVMFKIINSAFSTDVTLTGGF